MQLPFDNASRLQSAFNLGLEQLLEHATIETFILVLANASNDPAFFKVLQPRLM